ncbi:zinc ribbon domain-containing protein [Mediterraneibacter sp. NSJ-55]|uniref:Zinc ribbon domain-containing protein n=1 Tax=Mediterraneibacter hominis TaxID=2763054 RepID=A0A923RPT1_9FIRM|nr:zinc ribbon domain-containing protein [Mediterraneibacter hominis]MBC5688771.1 zinc ribbon domain-containing protein [Mediterraneibacter hominis]
MFCKNCGAQLNEGAKFCPKCGTPAVNGNAGGNSRGYQGGASPVQPQKKPPYLAIGLIAIVVVVVIVLAAVLGKTVFGKGYEKPIKNLIKGVEEQDGEIILSAFSENTIEAMEDQSGYDKKDLEDMMEEEFEYMFSGEDWEDADLEFKYEIEDSKKLDKDDIKDIEDELKDYWDIREDISAARELDVTMTVYVDGDEEDDNDATIEVIKVDGKWYINPISLN